MNSKKFRKVIYYKNYFRDFLKEQTINVKKKIIWTLELIEDIEKIPETYLKHISGTEGLYEIRINIGTNTYRIFCFFAEDKLVVLMNSFQKKTQKTPKPDLEKALKRMHDFLATDPNP
jgi:phage-related protein